MTKSISLDANTSYTIEEDTTIIVTGIECPSEIIIPKNVTLIFNGNGKLVFDYNVKLIGDHTCVVAPIAQIFGDNIEVVGTWNIDRAYPQWFGAVGYDRFDEISGTSEDKKKKNASPAINKAIIMKQTGEVFVPRGIYRISSPIKVSIGINLIGEAGILVSDEDSINKKAQATIFYVEGFDDTEFEGNNKYYVIYINCIKTDSGVSWEFGYPIPHTEVRNICFYNNMDNGVNGDTETTNPNPKNPYATEIKGMLIGGGAIIDRIVWHNFGQALAFVHEYCDCRSVTNCIYNNDSDKFKNIAKLYAFDMGWLGDALLFQHNQINDGKYNHGLRIYNCGGGSVNSNVINADILIQECKGITFSSNHVEGGHKIVIASSSVSMQNNYLEKGNVPNVILQSNQYDDECVVSMDGDMILNWESIREYDAYTEEKDENEVKYKELKEDSEIGVHAEYDIAIEDNCKLKLCNVYRYWFSVGFGKMYTYGLNLSYKRNIDGTLTETDFAEFNQHSYFLSRECLITSESIDHNPIKISNPNDISIDVNGLNDGVIWQAESGKYLYSYQIIWDKKRNLLKTINDKQAFPIGLPGITLKKCTSIKNPTKGVLLNIFYDNNTNCRALIRLARIKAASGDSPMSIKYVDIPICGTHYLYDNGLAICGYRWKSLPIGSAQYALKGNMGVESITFSGENVQCVSSSKEMSGDWTLGDVIYNCNDGEDWQMKIKTNNN